MIYGELATRKTLSGYYRCEDLLDYSGNGRHLSNGLVPPWNDVPMPPPITITELGPAKFANGQIHVADSYAYVDSAMGIVGPVGEGNKRHGPVTMSCWFKYDDTTVEADAEILSLSIYDDVPYLGILGEYYEMFYHKETPRLTLNRIKIGGHSSSTSIDPCTPLSTTEFSNIIACYDRWNDGGDQLGNIWFWYNGKKSPVVSAPPYPTGSGWGCLNRFCVGTFATTHPPGRYLIRGTFDDIIVEARCWSDQECLRYYGQAKGLSCPKVEM